MGERENGDLVRSFYANLQAGDLDAVLALLSDTFALAQAYMS